MENLLSTILNRSAEATPEQKKRGQFVRFIVTGTTATVVLYGVYYLLLLLMPLNPAYSIGFAVSFAVNFLMTSVYTFRSRPTVKGFVGFAGQQVFNYVMQLGCLNFFVWLGMAKEIAPIPVFIIILPINFILLRLVFKKKG
jgi:putative flippase GtrA